MGVEEQRWNVVVPVRGFVALTVVARDEHGSVQEAVGELNALLTALDWELDVGNSTTGQPLELHIDPLAVQQFVTVPYDGALSPQEASRLRVGQRPVRPPK